MLELCKGISSHRLQVLVAYTNLKQSEICFLFYKLFTDPSVGIVHNIKAKSNRLQVFYFFVCFKNMLSNQIYKISFFFVFSFFKTVFKSILSNRYYQMFF